MAFDNFDKFKEEDDKRNKTAAQRKLERELD